MTPKFLNWEHRSQLIRIFLNDLLPDIINLEEVDKFEEIKSLLPDHYSAKLFMKQDGVMGCATFWNSKSLQKLDQIEAFYSESAQ